MSDFNRDTSVAIATSFHHRGKVVCFSIVLPSRAMMMMMMKEDDGTPGEERKNERKKLLKASFFSLLGGKRKEKEEDHQFIWCQEFLLFFRVSLKFFLVCLSFFFKVKKTKSFVVLLLFRTKNTDH